MALAGFALGSLGAGWFSDRIGRRQPVIVVGTIGYALTCAAFAFLPWTSPMVGMAFFALLGFFSGGFIVTFAAAKEVVLPASAGMAVGLVNTGLFLGAAGMQPLFGWAMDLLWQGTVVNGVRIYAADDYRLGFLFMLGFALLAVVGAVRVRETYCRNLTVGDC
jgi:MFS family permease